MTIRTISCALALACAANFACAQNAAVETITVTGSRLPVNLTDLAASVTVLNEADIKASGATQLTDLLRGMPGISISQSGSPGSLAELRLRGSETNHLLVLIDGVIVNDLSQGGLVDFAHLTAANIAKVELLRGAQSALWGSGAVAGVVSITTKGNAQPADSANISAAAGNGGTYRGAVSASHNSNTLSASFYANHFTTDGDNVSRTGSEDDGYQNTTTGASIRWQVASQHSLSASVRVVDFENDYDATDFSTGLPADADNVTHGKQITSSLQWQFDLPEIGYRSEIKAQFHKDDNDNLTSGTDAGGTTGERKQVNWTHFFDLDVADLAFGGELLKREFEQRGPATYGDPNYRGDDSTNSVFAELTGWGTKALNTQFSVRYDDNARFDEAVSYRAGARYQFTQQVSVFASVSQAVKTPSFTELYGYFPASFIGNPDLQPEQSREYELGLSTALSDTFSAQLSVYATRLEQEIVSVWDADSGLSSVANTNEDSRRDGVEASLQWTADNWQLTAHYTYLDASQGDGSNQTVELRRPNHTGSLTYRHSLPVQGLSVYIKADYTGVRKDTFYPPWPASAQTLDLDPYWLVSANVNYALTKHWELGLRVDNALAQEYEDIVGYRGAERRYLAQASYQF